MTLNKFLLTLLLQGVIVTYAQVNIVGYAPQFKSKNFSIWKEEDFISKKRRIVQDTIVNDKGIFKFKLPPGPIEKYFIGMDDIYGYLYVQDGATYKIEFISDNPQNLSYNLQEEVELNFFDLDSNDINYKILGFEAWLDYSLSELHFEENNEGEKLRKITLLKYQIAKDARADTSHYFKDFMRYSVGMNIDNLSYMGSPTYEEKFQTYLSQSPIKYNQPYYCEYFENYYNQFINQIGKENATSFFQALASMDFAQQDSIIQRIPCTGDSELRSLLKLFLLKQAIFLNSVPKSVIKSNLKYQSEHSPFLFHRTIAKNLLLKISNLDVGDAFPFDRLNLKPFATKFVYVHAYNPSNTKCIQEIAALKKLKVKYGEKIEFLTLFVDKPLTNDTEKKAFDQINWTKIGLNKTDSLWNELGILTFPHYLVLDGEMNILYASALSPTPNGKYETIEKTFFDLTKP